MLKLGVRLGCSKFRFYNYLIFFRTKKTPEYVARLSKLDFIGIDVARIGDGSLKLIEVDRSPQFKRFTEITGINHDLELDRYLK